MRHIQLPKLWIVVEIVMARATKRQVQLELPKTRPRDKNDQFRGGARPGAGRPKRKRSEARASEPHKVRPQVGSTYPIHVVMRAHAELGSLRRYELFSAIREAMVVVLKLGETFRIAHFSVQRTHIHLIVEAVDRKALSEGMHSFGISCARRINEAVSVLSGKRRVGNVFTDRYYARILKARRDVRNTLMYVLNNWRHHGADRERMAPPMQEPWKIDPFSSALAFDGWKERPEGKRFSIPRGYEGASVWLPATWLLSKGWRLYGRISIFEVPGDDD
jgi:putative transposase